MTELSDNARIFCDVCQNHLEEPVARGHCRVYGLREQEQKARKDYCALGMLDGLPVGITLYSVLIGEDEYSRTEEWNLIEEQIRKKKHSLIRSRIL